MIPVLRPKLPSVDRLVPYLADIDRSRLYSNFGPHVKALENRLAAHFGLANGTVTTAANATLGLTLTLMAQAAPAGALCVMPAWTFIASANAVTLAGLTPYFVDIDPLTWTLDPAAIEHEIGRAPARVGAVMVVAPFGRPIDIQAWDDFMLRNGVPVVIDAAAAFDSLRVGLAPAVVSLHATKVLGIGEGGFVVSRDVEIIRNIRHRSNFGFRGARIAEVPALNAKLSEYQAAVGLAALDTWAQTRSAWMAVAGEYRRAFANSNTVQLQPAFGETWVSSTCVVSMQNGLRNRVRDALTAAEIDTRAWWGNGAHAEPAMEAFPRGDLRKTERLAQSTIGLPFYQDLSTDQVPRIAQIVMEASSE